MPPLTIAVTDLPPSQARQECFFEGAVTAISRSGLHATEKALLTQLPAIVPPPTSAVVTGNRTGVLPLALGHLYPEATITAHAYDSHHLAAIKRTISAHKGIHNITTVGSASLYSHDTDFNLALAQISHNSIPFELLQVMLQDIHQALATNGELIISFEGDAEWLRTQLKKNFGKPSLNVVKEIAIARVRKTNQQLKLKNFAATFNVSLPNGISFPLTTQPGVFAHRRPDQGGLSLAEIAAREVKPGDNILDIGSGSGLVGIALALTLPNVSVTFIDSHWCAYECAKLNANANSLTQTLFFCDHTDAPITPATFTMAVGNPPYFGNYTIAEHFVNTAHKGLKKGGRCFMVTKNSDWYLDYMGRLFGNATPLKRRDYTIVTAVKNNKYV